MSAGNTGRGTTTYQRHDFSIYSQYSYRICSRQEAPSGGLSVKQSFVDKGVNPRFKKEKNSPAKFDNKETAFSRFFRDTSNPMELNCVISGAAVEYISLGIRVQFGVFMPNRSSVILPAHFVMANERTTEYGGHGNRRKANCGPSPRNRCRVRSTHQQHCWNSRKSPLK